MTSMSCRQIAAVLGVSKSTAHRDRRAVEGGGRCRGNDGKSYPASREEHREMVAIALAAIAQGKPVGEVANAIGVSPRTLRRWREKWELR